MLSKGVEIRRGSYSSLADLFERFPDATSYFNCTGIGSRHLGNVHDTSVYPVRGQIVLIESPRDPVTRQYVRVSPQADNGGATYVFPRGKTGGIILGGCRQQDNWDGEVDMDLAKDIMERCCKLAPELGLPEDLKVIHHGVGLRRKFVVTLSRESVMTIASMSQGRSSDRERTDQQQHRDSQLWRRWIWISIVMVSVGIVPSTP